MKKRILSMLLVLCMVIGLLPMTAFAASVSVTFRLNYAAENTQGDKTITPSDTPLYYTTNDAKKFVKWTGTEAPADSDRYMKIYYPVADEAIVYVTLNKIDVARTSANYGNKENVIHFYEGAYALNITLQGENFIQTNGSACIETGASNGTTITGSGSLTLTSTAAPGCIMVRRGNLLIKDTTLNITHTSTSWRHAILLDSCNNTELVGSNNLAIEGSTITATTKGGSFVFFGRMGLTNTKYHGAAEGDNVTARTLHITDSTITATAGTSAKVFNTTTVPAVVRNSTITASNSSGTNRLFKGTPDFGEAGTYTAVVAPNTTGVNAVPYEGTFVGYHYFKIEPAQASEHTHTGGTATCTAQAVCEECGTAYGELAQHEKADDDGDCTTAVTCKNCTYVFTEAETEHTGGTATCEKKAECTACGKEYGELAAHTPAEDDGDCTTAVMCSICGEEATPAAAAHTGGTATCTAKAVCTACGKEYGEVNPDNHEFTVEFEKVEPTVSSAGHITMKCKNCDETDTTPLEQLAKPTIALDGTTVTLTDKDGVLVESGVTFVGANSAIDAATITSWTAFKANWGKNLKGGAGYTNNGTASSVTLAESGDYIFYVIYKDGEKNVFYTEKLTVVATAGTPEVTVEGHNATVNNNGSTVVESGVKFVGKDSNVDVNTLTGWVAFKNLPGTGLDGKAGYTNLGTETTAGLADSGDHIFYVIYEDAAGIRKTVYIKKTVTVDNDKPVINVVEGVATVDYKGRTIVESGVKYVGKDSNVDVSTVTGWGAFKNLTGTALDGKVGYTNLGTETTANLTKSGDYVYYVVYKDVNDVTRTIYLLKTV